MEPAAAQIELGIRAPRAPSEYIGTGRGGLAALSEPADGQLLW